MLVFDGTQFYSLWDAKGYRLYFEICPEPPAWSYCAKKRKSFWLDAVNQLTEGTLTGYTRKRVCDPIVGVLCFTLCISLDIELPDDPCGPEPPF